jgi:hypothetical protein
VATSGRKAWATAFDEMPEKQKEAGRHLYRLAIEAAQRGEVLTYSEAAASLKAAGLAYSSARAIGGALDGLAGVCGKLNVPDISSIYEAKGRKRIATLGFRV